MQKYFWNINKNPNHLKILQVSAFMSIVWTDKASRVYPSQIIGTAQNKACLLSVLQCVIVADGF